MSDFNTAVIDLITTCKNVCSMKQSSAFATKKEKKLDKNPLLRALDNYKTDFDLFDEVDNKADFMTAYDKYGVVIIKSYKLEKLLKTNNICIYSGANIDPNEKRKLALSKIFNLACELRDTTKSELANLPLEAYEDSAELLYPSYIQLYMYRSFLFALPEKCKEDIVKISDIIIELEKELKISENRIVPAETPSVGDMFGSAMGDGIASMAKDFVSKMGFEMPKDVAMPGGANIMEIATGFFTRPETKELLSDFGNSMNGVKDMGEGIQRLVSKFQEPESIEKITKVASSLFKQEIPEG